MQFQVSSILSLSYIDASDIISRSRSFAHVGHNASGGKKGRAQRPRWPKEMTPLAVRLLKGLGCRQRVLAGVNYVAGNSRFLDYLHLVGPRRRLKRMETGEYKSRQTPNKKGFPNETARNTFIVRYSRQRL